MRENLYMVLILCLFFLWVTFGVYGIKRFINALKRRVKNPLLVAVVIVCVFIGFYKISVLGLMSLTEAIGF